MAETTGSKWARGGPHKDKLQEKMKDPRPTDQIRGGEIPAAALGQWFKDVEAWGRRMRRDIILLEAYLRELKPDMDIYDDPGDPPPPPNSF